MRKGFITERRDVPCWSAFPWGRFERLHGGHRVVLLSSRRRVVVASTLLSVTPVRLCEMTLDGVCVVVVVVVVRTICNLQLSVHLRARVQSIETDQCQCIGPFGWTNQPDSTASSVLRKQIPGAHGGELNQPRR